MVTLVVAVILGAIAAPSIQAFIKNNRMSGQSIDFVGDLNLARSEAIKRALPFSPNPSVELPAVKICKLADPAGGTAPTCNTTPGARWDFGWAVFLDQNGNHQIDSATDTLIKVHEPLTGGNTLAISSIPGERHDPANFLVFKADGTTTLSTSGQATFRLCDSRGMPKAQTVSVIPSGRIRVSNTTTSCP